MVVAASYQKDNHTGKQSLVPHIYIVSRGEAGNGGVCLGDTRQKGQVRLVERFLCPERGGRKYQGRACGCPARSGPGPLPPGFSGTKSFMNSRKIKPGRRVQRRKRRRLFECWQEWFPAGGGR